MSERQCSSCTACCEGWLRSVKLDMKPGKPCVHCTAQGCAIYENRPEKPCRTFKCAWLADDETLPENMRPNQCGAIVMLDRKWNGWSIIKAVPTGVAIPEETLEWLKAYSRKKHIPLLFETHLEKDGRFCGIKRMGYGPPAFLERVKMTIGPDDIMKI